MHAHLALLMLAVVTAFCEETRRGRSKFTLVLRIGVLVRGEADLFIIIQHTQHVVHLPHPRRIALDVICCFIC